MRRSPTPILFSDCSVCRSASLSVDNRNQRLDNEALRSAGRLPPSPQPSPAQAGEGASPPLPPGRKLVPSSPSLPSRELVPSSRLSARRDLVPSPRMRGEG